jgi:tRNA(fMet)-specific endonuclease VapC
VVAELWYVVKNSGRFQENAARLNLWMAGMRRLDFIEAAAEEFGGIKAALRRAGRTIPDMDIQIAAIASVHDMTVLTADAHFGFIAGLRTENWLQ